MHPEYIIMPTHHCHANIHVCTLILFTIHAIYVLLWGKHE